MRPLVRLWRDKGLKVIIYQDDAIVSVRGVQEAIAVSAQVKFDSGFIVNMEKSCWVPSQVIGWLDFQIDLAKGTFSVPLEKTQAL